MKKQNMTNLERQYNRFDLFSKIALFAILGFTFVFGFLFVFAKSDELKALFGLLMTLSTVSIFFVAPKIGKKRTIYLQQLCEERDSVVRTGLFAEVYDAYRYDGFEFNLTYEKLDFVEYHNNSIDIGLQKNKHEFLIEIDENFISIIVDEETDSPIEKEIPLSSIASIEQLYTTINEFINAHS